MQQSQTRYNIICSPPYEHTLEKFMEEKSPFYSKAYGKNPYFLLKEALEGKGYDIYDSASIGNRNVDIAIHFRQERKYVKRYSEAIQIYIVVEPPIDSTFNSRKNLQKVLGMYDYILSVFENADDSERIQEIRMPMDLGVRFEGTTPFTQKKLLTSISSNRFSKKSTELYSARRKVIDYFEKSSMSGFEFYGRGWTSEQYKNYQGEADCKLETFDRYKYAIIFENGSINGNISEKIFDCFFAGCVPIYMGAPDVHQYIPQNCYIRYDQFPDVQACVDHIASMNEEEWERYRSNAVAFLRSDAAKKFGPEALADKIIACAENGTFFTDRRRSLFHFDLLRLKRGFMKVLKDIQKKTR